MSKDNGFHKFGIAVLWTAIVLASIASICVFGLIYITGDLIGIPWLFLLIIWAFMALIFVAVAFLVIGAIVGPRQ